MATVVPISGKKISFETSVTKNKTNDETTTKNIIKSDFKLKKTSTRRFKVLTLQKIKRIIGKYIDHGINDPDFDQEDFLSGIVPFMYLGEKLHGLAWKGDRDDEEQLLSDLLTGSLFYIKETKKEYDRNQNASYFAFNAFLEFFAETFAVLNTIFFFWEGKSFEG